MLHISQVLYKKEQSDAIKEGRPIKDFGEFVGHLNQHIYNDSIFAGKVHDNIVKILLKTQLVVDQKYAIIGGGDKIEQTKGVEGKEQQVAKTRDHPELPIHPERSEEPSQTKDNQPFDSDIPASNKSAAESTEFKWTEDGITKLLATSQTKDELDVKLQKIIQDNPEINQKIEEHGGYDNLKQRLVEIAIATNQQQNESKDSGWWYGIKELFGISEAEASSVARRGIGLLGSAEIGKNEAVVDGTPAFSRTPANPKDEAIKWLVEHMDSGMLLTTLIALTAPPINEFNVSNDFEKRKHDDSSNKPSTSKQQQKVSATFFMPSDPNDNDPDDEFSHFKKKDGSNRYECEKQESPEWKNSQNFKDEFRTNGGTGKNKEYYRWDMKHKDIEVYDNKARLIGSKDPVTGKIYRQGNMMRNEKLWGIIK
ncbi:hypothetical protein [Candidatus Tisiphia endosymbiont of Ptychoptera albimana]|uniref:hypothetical protein n=1 Tax=Candidatus Tisiphia endosymbiont of Ptychoptera albimana TaxID=3066260 RepID=UPI00312CAAA0